MSALSLKRETSFDGLPLTESFLEVKSKVDQSVALQEGILREPWSHGSWCQEISLQLQAERGRVYRAVRTGLPSRKCTESEDGSTAPKVHRARWAARGQALQPGSKALEERTASRQEENRQARL